MFDDEVEQREGRLENEVKTLLDLFARRVKYFHLCLECFLKRIIISRENRDKS